jgi:photosystem II stability/assembly factor-like uncharacterized protein
VNHRTVLLALPLAATLLLAGSVLADKKDKKKEDKADEGPLSAGTFTGLAFRAIGPALESGRIVDIAVDPRDPARYFVAAASGGVWKTTNASTTWTPVFDGEGSYSIGCVTIDPTNPLVVWVGSGENNSQRSVGYGDGVYKSVDGGTSWKKVGLDKSEHIGKIVVHPKDGKVVYVAAQGPLWAPGGDRGLYKTTDGGATWNRILDIDENTGVSDIVMDPRDPEVLIASSYQRRRHVWTLINGGPGSGLHKTTDGGASWTKLENGLPKDVDMGRIGLAISPAKPDVVYALIEAQNKESGLYASVDGGTNWEKRGDHNPVSPQYYQEIVADPADADRIYSMDTFMQVSEDGGKTFKKVGERWKHVDNHALWIDPADTRHLRGGCDGGVYESWDRGATWHFKDNLPITQFYRVSVDEAKPFYNIYGGTQDNATLGGPSRTMTSHGIRNGDWYVTVFGDGFETCVDPTDPAILYSQSQYGELVRYDHRSGEVVGIQPQPAAGEPPLRWNWDSALVLSPHSPARLYFGANRLFRSDDRGDSWKAVSPDLTRQLDRNKLAVMGRVWGVDAVAKNASTSFYGNIVSLSESPLAAGLIYAGTDDGLVQVTEDGGASWRKFDTDELPGVGELTYVSSLSASLHETDTVYAALDAHKSGDFKPHLFRSTNRGRSWTSIAGDLPERGTVYAVIQDHVNGKLLFAGTEFGVFFSPDGGAKWIQLKGGMPVIAVRDIDIQRREDDLVLGTFGRGFYVLDDYSPLRQVSVEQLDRAATLFPVKEALAYVERAPLGLDGKSMQGDSYFTAPNPPFGAVFTYYLKEELKTRKKTRQEQERKTHEDGGEVNYPDWSALRAEAREEDPVVLLTVADEDGNVVRQLTGPVEKGFHRVAWNLRYPPAVPARLEPYPTDNPFDQPPQGPFAAPGVYEVTLSQVVAGETKVLGGPEKFTVTPLGLATLPAADREALVAFQRRTAGLQRAVLGAQRTLAEARTRLDHIQVALRDTPGGAELSGLLDEARALEVRLDELSIALSGDAVVARYNEPTPPSIVDRVQRVISGQWSSTSAPTVTHLEGYRIASEEFGSWLPGLRQAVEEDLRKIEDRMEAAGAPWTPGRVPRWTPER